jgi:hyperosmotically inducible protein
MKPFAATLLATALTAAFSSAYAADTKPDTATYKTMTQKAAADYKIAAAKCNGLAASDRALCVEEAKVARARMDIDTVGQYNNTVKARLTARTALANAEHALAKAKCAVLTGADKDTCLSTAHSVHTAALADAKADREVRVAGTAAAAVDGKGLIANTGTTEPVKAAAVDKCAQVAGGSKDTACLIDNKDRVAATNTAGAVADRTENAAANAAANTRSAATTVAQKTENLAETAVQKTKNAAAIVADKTERAVDRIADRTDAATDRAAVKTDRAGDRVAATTDNAAAKTSKAVSDTVITTKVKADLFKEPELSAMAIHVETEKGVVMLSGFVDTKADADKAVKLAKSVEGVTQVKSAIKVK